jgi:Holliday junction resolvase RusA-like endonuclease
MTLVCAITVIGPPVPKARARVTRTGHAYTPAKTRHAEARIAQHLAVRYPGLQPSTARLRVVLRFHLKGTRGDIDNCAKLVMDSLNGRAFVDDKQVDKLDVSITRSSYQPRTELEVWTI